ncbi:hypothetical protein H696_04368 [Fonticula alba]|uniref:Casein kinase II subunit beta n=1 Tax=Fonticula alba TaxID=691883 RepID=A0A058Z3U5_FONAL|nr:hypothetical protein H696_04368 [Fonticula alba]KCV68949.1 hypothetical protein H696_04368 [Fonticula alba]|eukprot:XP_009496520.1 hypothetical protein H696_04368 [Fonticula alba]
MNNTTWADCDSEGDSEGASNVRWISRFLNKPENEFLCEVDFDFINDRFNLTGLHHEVQNYRQAYEVLLDSPLSTNLSHDLYQSIDIFAAHLYGLIHARFILTYRGMQKMLQMYQEGRFGTCPRILCEKERVLPIGISDLPNAYPVRVFCPRCVDIYQPSHENFSSLDGAYFGSTFPHLLNQLMPTLLSRSSAPSDTIYLPRIFGFRLYKPERTYPSLRRLMSPNPHLLPPNEQALGAGGQTADSTATGSQQQAGEAKQ